MQRKAWWDTVDGLAGVVGDVVLQALRDYARTKPETVRAFLSEHAQALSGLTRREAGKHLG